MKHILPDCFAVYYNNHVHEIDITLHGDELCEQGWGDYYIDGINKKEAKIARRRK